MKKLVDQPCTRIAVGDIRLGCIIPPQFMKRRLRVRGYQVTMDALPELKPFPADTEVFSLATITPLRVSAGWADHGFFFENVGHRPHSAKVAPAAYYPAVKAACDLKILIFAALFRT